MLNKTFLKIAALALALSFLAPAMAPRAAAMWDEIEDADDSEPGWEAQVGVWYENYGVKYEPPVLVGADGKHPGYINGCGDGGFHPSEELTRAQATVMLYRLIESPGEERVEFPDVPQESWYSEAVGYLGALGVLGPTYEALRPDETVTRGEFAAMIDYLMLGHDFESGETAFPDVPLDHKYAREIACAAEHGWLRGNENGEFKPDGPITRAEAVTVTNRLLGAVPDREYMKDMYFSPFSDVFSNHWAYYDIMEASVSHTHLDTGESGWVTADLSGLARAEGIYFSGLDYLYVNGEGHVVRDGYVGSRYFGPDGLYTSGSVQLDGYVKSVISAVVKPGMSDMEKLRAVYDYTRDSFTYLRRNYYEAGDVSWANDEALTMFTTGRGNCYCYAAVFYALARQLGFDPVLISGKVNNSNPIPHAWVEMEENGKTYMYDAELEMAHLARGDVRDLFRMDVDDTPWSYWR